MYFFEKIKKCKRSPKNVALLNINKLPEKIETKDYNRESTVHTILLLTGFL